MWRRCARTMCRATMLFADKRALERQLEVDLIAIRQKELDHYTHCCLTLSAPAALLAGFAYTALVQVIVPDDAHPVTEALFYASVISAMVFNVAAVVKVTLVALCAPHMALRGPPGSMNKAVDEMRPAFFLGMKYFWVGLVCVHISAGVTVWLNAHAEARISTATTALIFLTTLCISFDIRRTICTFHVPTSRAIDGKFTPERAGQRSDAAGTAQSLIRRLQQPALNRERSLALAELARCASAPRRSVLARSPSLATTAGHAPSARARLGGASPRACARTARAHRWAGSPPAEAQCVAQPRPGAPRPAAATPVTTARKGTAGGACASDGRALAAAASGGSARGCGRAGTALSEHLSDDARRAQFASDARPGRPDTDVFGSGGGRLFAVATALEGL
ncbi:hypothetical protein KFE25_004126 [Diacronema lutheri]|uniref:Uncharacterized protein n=1 Tax=Diacronema lutheri TaxID=2081491 RepID=A0A8J5X4V6_DIALT|nr:hypothetical protein KFE25_004126 [Diacronema lutheri]